MVGPGEAVLDAVFIADPVEDVAAEDGLELGVAAAVLGQVGKGHAPWATSGARACGDGSTAPRSIVGQHGVQPTGENRHDLAQESGAIGLGVGVEEGDVGELGDAVDRQEHEELALGQAQLADVEVDVADPGFGEPLALRGPLVSPR
jgi:hypothetical protein